MKQLLRIRSIHNEERGETLIEFAVSAVVLLTLIFAIMEFARAMYIYHFVSYAAQTGTRYAIVRGSTWKTACSSSTSGMDCIAADTDVSAYVKSIAPPGVDTSKLTVNTNWLATAGGSSGATCTTVTNNPGCLVQVTVSYQFKFVAPFMPSKSPTLSASSEQVIQQ